jgi:hypothetical protein
MLAKHFEDTVHNVLMEFWVIGGMDENVIHVDSDIPSIYEVPKDMIHHGLECCR